MEDASRADVLKAVRSGRCLLVLMINYIFSSVSDFQQLICFPFSFSHRLWFPSIHLFPISIFSSFFLFWISYIFFFCFLVCFYFHYIIFFWFLHICPLSIYIVDAPIFFLIVFFFYLSSYQVHAFIILNSSCELLIFLSTAWWLIIISKNVHNCQVLSPQRYFSKDDETVRRRASLTLDSRIDVRVQIYQSYWK